MASPVKTAGIAAWRFAVALAGVLAAVGPLAAQPAPGPTIPPMDTLSLGRGTYSRMEALLEKTIFKVDVLTLEVRLGEKDARRVQALAAGRTYSKALADSIAEVAIHSQDAWAQIEFLRGASLKQFLDGIDDNLSRAWDAGIISEANYEMISKGLPRWFAFLEARRIRKGDRIRYRVLGDTLRTQYWAASGELLLDQVDVGPERRLAVLGSYFARRSEFREDLVRSLFERNG